MIYFDVTKSSASNHNSGLMRVSKRLLLKMKDAVAPVVWKKGGWRYAEHWQGHRAGAEVAMTSADWFFTTELFSESERPGFAAFLASRTCRMAAIFHDAIPLKFPEITWPQSVIRAPGYMKKLARFDRVLAISEYSAEELVSFWKWQGIPVRATVEKITLGANFTREPRGAAAAVARSKTGNPALLCVGILEPRKNQSFLMDVCEALWDDGLVFDLHLVGRVNKHFGDPVKDKVKRLRKKHRHLQFHEGASDAELTQLYRSVRAAVFPTIAEGCGLPPLEALWMGVPCVCSDLAVLREYTGGGGCVTAGVNDLDAWKSTLRRVITDDAWVASLRAEAAARELPRWADTAAEILQKLQ